MVACTKPSVAAPLTKSQKQQATEGLDRQRLGTGYFYHLMPIYGGPTAKIDNKTCLESK